MTAMTLILGTSFLALLGLILSVELRDSDERIIQCPKCHLIIDKERVHISGYDSENSSRHIHCPRCKAYIAM